MPAATVDWIGIAEDDLNVAEMAFDPKGRAPSYYATCYHCQQCCEKYLKAFLLEKGAPFPKTHDLYHLLQLSLPFAPTLEELGNELRLVLDLAMNSRYPGGPPAEKDDAATSLEITRRLRSAIRALISVQ